MSPLKIEILLHYYAKADEYDGDMNAPAVREAISEFVRDGMLEPADRQYGRSYRATAKANHFIAHICDLPLPEMVWRMPCAPEVS